MSNINTNIKVLREEARLSVEEFAEKMNVSQNTVVRWENNYKFPTQNNLIQLSRIFHVSLDYLVGIERKRTIVVEQLTQEQITVLNTLVLEFQFRQKGTGLTQRQMNILNAVIVAFTK